MIESSSKLNKLKTEKFLRKNLTKTIWKKEKHVQMPENCEGVWKNEN